VALTWQLVNLNELIEQQVIESKALSERHTFRLERPSIPVSIRVDATRVSQAVSNLLSNAVKYSPKGGEIVVKLEESTKEVVINISDQGVGIPADKVERLSQPFYRVEEPETKQVEGLGLGLALVRSIVEAHGGKIWVKSEPGKGSTFSFSLPK
jgi:signal transduction histidine kinase